MPQTSIKKFPFIDALRGIAILGVILYHSSLSVAPKNQILLWFMRQGALGVQLFFVISSLTLFLSWKARSTHEISPTRNFFIRRFFRIAPMFYLAIIAYILINGFSPSFWAPNGVKWWFIPITAAFLHGFHPETHTAVVPGGWAIAVEMNFYLIVPFLIPHIKTLKFCLLLFIISVIFAALNLFIVPHIFPYSEYQHLKVFIYASFFNQLPVFILGLFCYLIFSKNYPRKNIAIIGGLIFLLLFLALLFPVFKLPNNFIAKNLLIRPHHIFAGGLFSVFTLMLANWPIGLLVNRFTTTLGKLSYSMYLTHFAILTYFSKLGFSAMFPRSNIASLLHFLCVVLISAFVSFFLYKLVEKTGIKIGRRLIEKLEKKNRGRCQGF